MTHKQFSGFDYFLMICLLAIPFITYQKIADPSLLSRQILYLIICLGALVYMFVNRKEILWIPISHPFIVAISVWLGVYLIGFIDVFSFSEYFYTASKIALYACGIYLFTLLFLNQKVNTIVLNRSVTGLVWIAFAFLAFEIASQHKLGIDLLKDKNLYQLSTVFSHKNLFSSALLLCFPFMVQTVIRDKKAWKIFAGTALLLMIPALLFIQTKAVIAGMGIAAFICIFPLSKLIKPHYPKIYIWGLFTFGVCMLSFIILSFLYSEKFILLYNNETFKERILLWQNTWSMIKEFPFMGVGGGNWQIFFPKYGLQHFMQTNYLISDGYTTFQRPHNDFLWVWSETGLIGLIAYISIFVIALKTCYKSFKRGKNHNESLIFLSLFFTLIAYIIIAFFDFPLERNEHQLLLALILAHAIGSNRNQQKEGNTKTGKNSLILVLALLCGSLFIALKRLPAERSALKIIQAHAVNDWDKIIRETPKCISPFYTLDNFSIPINWYSGVAHYAHNDLPAAKSDFEMAYTTNPYQVHVLNNIAGLYEKEGKHKQALQYYNELLQISPTQPDAILNKSAVLFNMNQINDAFACLYQFKYDEGNTQFIGYLNVIGKAYIETRIELEKDVNKKIKWQLISQNETWLRYFFKYNKEQQHHLNQLVIPPIK